MPHLSRKSKRYIAAFFTAFVISELCFLFVPSKFPVSHISTLIYSAIVISWIITVRRRVTQEYIRGYLSTGGVALVMLFVLRLMKWQYFGGNITSDRLIWYAYYIPITIIPAVSLLISFRIGKNANQKEKWYEYFFILLLLCLQILVLTNDFHGIVFEIEEYTESIKEYSYGTGYIIIILWCVGLNLLGLGILLIKCRNSSARKLWWIPLFSSGIGYVLLFIYFMNDGEAPSFNGNPLYNFQEAYSLIFITTWEASLRIGLIPSNSDYEDLFKIMGIGAVITDNEGKVKYKSDDAIGISKEMLSGSLDQEDSPLGRDKILKKDDISGGTILWVEDHSTVNALNDSLSEAVSLLSEENSLLEMENEIKAQKQSIETKGRLYDRISEKARPQLKAINDIIVSIQEKKTDMSEGLKTCLFLGAYVKRISNLTILNEQYGKLRLEELRLAIRESVENLTLMGIESMVSGKKTDKECRGESIIYAYDFFEKVVEMAVPTAANISCIISGENGLKLDILLDKAKEIPVEEDFAGRPEGTEIEILQEDEGIYLRFHDNMVPDAAAPQKGGGS